MHDLLHDPLIGIRTREGEQMVCLPELFARLCGDDVLAYTGVRPHQADPWHVLLVQLAVSILARHPRAEMPIELDYWRHGLLDLAGGQDTAWQLVVEDLTKPAFMQHPLSDSRHFSKFKLKATCPDGLDILITSKDHDVKMERAGSLDPTTWLNALVACQTLSGFLGAGNFGSIRMNGGFASRPIVSLVSNLGPAARFKEEVELLLQHRQNILAAGFNYRDAGVVLTWLTPWDGQNHQYVISELDPFFIEAVRPTRLVGVESGIGAWCATSKVRQIGPANLDNGDMGDPWIPLNTTDKKKGVSALTMTGSGWAPERLTQLLFQDGFKLTFLQEPRASSRDLWFTGSVLVRGQGTTEGFHRFAIPVPAKAQLTLLHRARAESLGAFARELLRDAKEAGKAVRAALMALAEGGPASVDFGREAVATWAEAARDRVFLGWEERYFPALWEAIDPSNRGKVRSDWRAQLLQRARDALVAAERDVPVPAGRRYRAIYRAHAVLAGSLVKSGVLERTTERSEEVVA